MDGVGPEWNRREVGEDGRRRGGGEEELKLVCKMGKKNLFN